MGRTTVTNISNEHAVNLDPADVDRMIRLSAAMGMTPQQWLRTLLDVQMGRTPPLRPGDVDSLADCAEAFRQIRDLLGLQAPEERRTDIVYHIAEALTTRVRHAEKENRAYWGVPEMA